MTTPKNRNLSHEHLRLLRAVENTRREMHFAKKTHYKAIQNAVEAGVSNVGIAMSCGVSETAIRKMAERKGWRRGSTDRG